RISLQLQPAARRCRAFLGKQFPGEYGEVATRSKERAHRLPGGPLPQLDLRLRVKRPEGLPLARDQIPCVPRADDQDTPGSEGIFHPAGPGPRGTTAEAHRRQGPTPRHTWKNAPAGSLDTEGHPV